MTLRRHDPGDMPMHFLNALPNEASD